MTNPSCPAVTGETAFCAYAGDGIHAPPGKIMRTVSAVRDLNEIIKLLLEGKEPRPTQGQRCRSSTRRGEAGRTYKGHLLSRAGVAGTLHAHRQRTGREEAPAGRAGLIMSDAFE